MSFGLETFGFNNSLSFSTQWPSLQYYGKATRVTGTGLTFFNADTPSQYKRTYIPSGIYNQYESISGVGVRQIGVSGWCGGNTLSLTIPNDTGVYTYSIATPDYPQVFINSTSQDISGTVISINNSGNTSDGMPVWYIKVMVAYPSGMRDSALPYLSLYCFAKIRNQVPSGYGITTFLSNGTLSYSSSVKTLLVKDIVTINSTTLSDPNNLGSLIVNDVTSPNPVVAWNAMSKPSFLNIDWGHYTWRQSAYVGNVAYGWDSTYGECEDYGPVYDYFTQGYIAGGVRLNSSKTARIYNLHGLDVVDWGTSLRTNLGNLITKIESNFPIYIPIIDGADYD